MSLFAILYATEPETSDIAAATAFPGHSRTLESNRVIVQTNAMRTSVGLRTKPNFDSELFGIESKVSFYFAIDDLRATEARYELAAAVRQFLSATSGDVVMTYLDILVLKRVGDHAVCAISYADLLPAGGANWKMVPALEQPE
jgi:hypothetical protein